MKKKAHLQWFSGLENMIKNMTHKVAVSILNLPVKGKGLYNGFLLKLYTISLLHKQISALQHNVSCLSLSALMIEICACNSHFFFLGFCQSQEEEIS